MQMEDDFFLFNWLIFRFQPLILQGVYIMCKDSPKSGYERITDEEEGMSSHPMLSFIAKVR